MIKAHAEVFHRAAPNGLAGPIRGNDARSRAAESWRGLILTHAARS